MTLSIEKGSTALVVIDLQKGIAAAGRPTGPHSVETVVANAVKLADTFRSGRMPVCLVHVVASPDERLVPLADEPGWRPTTPPAPDAGEFVPAIGSRAGDIVISK